MKKFFALILALMMSLAALPALAAPGDAMPFHSGAGGAVHYGLQSAAVLDGVIYAASYDGLYRYVPGDEAPTTLDFGENPPLNARLLFTWEDKLYALSQEWTEDGSTASIVQVLPLEDGKASVGDPLALDWATYLNSQDDEYGGEFDCPVVVDGRLYMISMNWRDQSSSLISFSLEDGSCTISAEPKDLLCIARYKDGRMLAFTRAETASDPWSAPAKAIAFDPKTGESTDLFTLDKPASQYYGLAYDEAADTVYYLIDSQLIALKGTDPASAQAVNVLPLQGDSAMPRPGHLLPGGLYMFFNYGNMMIRNTDPSLQPERKLVLSGFYEMDAAYHAFASAQPDVAVVLKTGYNTSLDQINQAMMSQSDEIDIYRMNLSEDAFRVLKQRGFLAEITDEAAKAEVARMYPAVQEALMVNGKLCAFPLNAYGSTTGYNKAVLKKLNLTEEDLPHTWAELIDFVVQWPDRFGKDFPELSPFDPSVMPELRYYFVQQIFDNYRVRLNVPDSQLAFNTPELRAVLEKLDATDFSGVETEPSEDGSYSWEGDSVLFENGEGSLSSWSGQSVPYPITISQGEEPLFLLSLEVCVINPYSKNQDLAMEYIAQCAKNMPQLLRGNLIPGEDEPIRDSYYLQNLNSMNDYLARLKEDYDQLSAADKPAQESYIKEAEENIKRYEEVDSWQLTAEAVAAYRARAEHMVIDTGAGFGQQNYQESYSLIQRYVDRQISMDQFVSGMDQKIRMMMMEGF